ncbi:MAG: hypothetical protein JWR32_1018 [Mycobacterium sp.]|nr:hypothetical protein [Mycobacterium sp.]
MAQTITAASGRRLTVKVLVAAQPFGVVEDFLLGRR